MSDKMTDHEDVVFCGRVSRSVAHVYLRLPGLTSEARISGEIEGPFCNFAKTLPARTPLTRLAPGDTFLAESVIPDPCVWTPLHPAYYKIRFRIEDGSILIEKEREFGIKAFGVSRQSFFMDSNRWVLRGVECRSIPADDLGWLRESNGTLVLNDEAALKDAHLTRAGVPALLRIESAIDEPGSLIRRLGRFAAVVAAAFPASMNITSAHRAHAPNLVLLAEGEGHPEWADGLILSPSSQLDGHASPIVIRQPCVSGGIEERRAACDELQRQMASTGDFAGYLV